jgi:hypothetical protein
VDVERQEGMYPYLQSPPALLARQSHATAVCLAPIKSIFIPLKQYCISIGVNEHLLRLFKPRQAAAAAAADRVTSSRNHLMLCMLPSMRHCAAWQAATMSPALVGGKVFD